MKRRKGRLCVTVYSQMVVFAQFGRFVELNLPSSDFCVLRILVVDENEHITIEPADGDSDTLIKMVFTSL
jgi:hypothetical protein